jgi:hypothetical protein
VTRDRDFPLWKPGIDLDRPNNGGHVSRDYPFRETGSREIGSPGDKRSGLSIVETRDRSGPSE